MEDQLSSPSLHLAVAADALPFFTTVLQSGIEIKTLRGETLAKFLNNFPGFTAEYLANTVQTIFLNGTAVDDLSLPLTRDNTVLALSAAMPGLAGAIFRKNSFHAALRTETKSLPVEAITPKSITVILKLFNSIARERGAELLQSGRRMQANLVAAFLDKRPHLFRHIVKIELDRKEMSYPELLSNLPNLSTVNLSIVAADE